MLRSNKTYAVSMDGVVAAAILLIAFWSTSSHATNITPTEKFGSLKIVADLKAIPGEQAIYTKLIFSLDTHARPLKFDFENVVAAGEGCLEISYSAATAKQCGIVIKEKQLTTVNLSVLKVEWNPDLLKVDIGPKPVFTITGNATDRSFSTMIDPMAVVSPLVYVLPGMTVSSVLGHAETGELHRQDISVANGTASSSTLQVPEKRATLFVDLIDGAPKFATAATNFQFIYGKQKQGPAINDNVIQSIGVNSNFQSTRVKVFPLLPEVDKHYEVTVNEMLIQPQLRSQEEFRIPVGTLNVHHYKSRKGYFKIFSNYADPSRLQRLKFRTNPIYDAPPYGPVENIATETSLIVALGLKYRLDFYATDDFGRSSLQDQVEVDLTR